jgi:hypothetical protein
MSAINESVAKVESVRKLFLKESFYYRFVETPNARGVWNDLLKPV